MAQGGFPGPGTARADASAGVEQAEDSMRDAAGGGEIMREESWWCRHCGQPVVILEKPPRKAVHAGTGLEKAPDLHLAAPMDHEPSLWKAARELRAEFGGAFVLSARFGILRADWADLGAGLVAAHFEAPDEETMRTRLNAAVARRDRGMVAAGAAAPGADTSSAR